MMGRLGLVYLSVFCSNCGNKLNADAKFCSSCGKKFTPKVEKHKSFFEKPEYLPINMRANEIEKEWKSSFAEGETSLEYIGYLNKYFKKVGTFDYERIEKNTHKKETNQTLNQPSLAIKNERSQGIIQPKKTTNDKYIPFITFILIAATAYFIYSSNVNLKKVDEYMLKTPLVETENKREPTEKTNNELKDVQIAGVYSGRDNIGRISTIILKSSGTLIVKSSLGNGYSYGWWTGTANNLSLNLKSSSWQPTINLGNARVTNEGLSIIGGKFYARQ